jgi:hypothetical protein
VATAGLLPADAGGDSVEGMVSRTMKMVGGLRDADEARPVSVQSSATTVVDVICLRRREGAKVEPASSRPIHGSS